LRDLFQVVATGIRTKPFRSAAAIQTMIIRRETRESKPKGGKNLDFEKTLS
jgi:hypothetical protein